MFSTWNAVALSGADPMMMSRSSLRMRCARSMSFLALEAGSTAKTWPYLFLNSEPRSLAGRPTQPPRATTQGRQ